MQDEEFYRELSKRKIEDIFYSLPVDANPKSNEEVAKYLHEIAIELKRIRQTLERRR